jgi:phosphatidylserine/phosphatidylglycerophosphate/cardiolipin synthase-like enzyme
MADKGIGIERVLGRALAAAEGHLLIATPFFDPDARVWGLLWQALSAGAAVDLITRWPEEPHKQTELHNLARSGVAVKVLPTLHAKAVLFVCGKKTSGWIGSMNLTVASESRTAELGVFCSQPCTAGRKARLGMLSQQDQRLIS